jgi:hypothetical protein
MSEKNQLQNHVVTSIILAVIAGIGLLSIYYLDPNKNTLHYFYEKEGFTNDLYFLSFKFAETILFLSIALNSRFILSQGFNFVKNKVYTLWK